MLMAVRMKIGGYEDDLVRFEVERDVLECKN